MLPSAAALVLALACVHAHADYILSASPDAAIAGNVLTIVLTVTNDADEAMSAVIPAHLELRLTTEGEAYNVTFPADPPLASVGPDGTQTVQLAPQTFRKVRYGGKLPDALTGVTTLRPRAVAADPLVLVVHPGARQAPQSIIAETPAAPAASAGQSGSTPTSRFLSALSVYDPVYFAVGTRERTNAKFQLSFKYRFFTEDGPLAQRVNFLQDLYLGYTQTSLWDLESNSAPFYDSSYKPRLFYYNRDVWDGAEKKISLGLEGGLGHESNGKSGTDSRSINFAYVKPIFTLGDPQGWHWTVAPMLIDYLSTSDNPDIADYRGYVDLQVGFGKDDGAMLTAQLRKGSQGFSSEWDLTFPLRAVALGNLNGYLMLQYFNGYGESILDYNQRYPSQVRLGLMFVR